ncbi:MAG: preprotein translocase subunit SecA [Deltaproteobacteria bacterium]|nr:preprotein translocase subunit SecA [Deltaproteobacteria bacterium]
MGFFAKIFGTKNERELKPLIARTAAIGSYEDRVKGLADDQMARRILELKAEITKQVVEQKKPRLAKNEDLSRDEVNAILDPHLNEVFALVREAGKRVMGMRHYDVQLIGGMVLHSGRVAEMKTGEGKTLVATAPAVLNALTGESVHVVTVNDYLATRDAEWMGRIYRFLGLSCGVVVPHQGDRQKREAYQSDITYGQNNEFGFDYLRDNMKFSFKDYMQRGHGLAIVDEVDSILIDEARTPLIISGPSDESIDGYKTANTIVPQLRKDEHYTIDEKGRQVIFTEAGVHRAEKLVGVDNLYDPVNIETLHRLTQSLRAHTLYKRDVDYVIEKGEVVIVDEHTGRLMYGRRWSDGLHGAVEAKENVRIQPETRTLATISFQNYFRMYRKLGGMTGTADTEAEEFAKIYNLDVILIPTNKKILRVDEQDLIYKTEREKFDAIVADIDEAHGKGQPVLVGTVSVEKSEVLANLLKKRGIDHRVLNAKKHKDEAGIVAQAGKKGAVTIATNMAGRGTDILLGGNPEYMARQQVAEHMGGTAEQVAEYAFLTGRADLINIEKLAERDSRDARFLSVWEERAREWQEAVDVAAGLGEDITGNRPADLPSSIDQARLKVKDERLAFYKKCVEEYESALAKFEAECARAKDEVKTAGGLRIIGTERHESRRIDNQLRGRAGRQGDPGSSRFYLSLQDDLMRIFGGDKMIRLMEMLGMKEGEPIEHNMVTSSIADAQKRVEGMHFDSRKNLIEYDDVMNQQRKSVYGLRKKILQGSGLKDLVYDLVEEAIVSSVQRAAPEKAPPSEWKTADIVRDMDEALGVAVDLTGLRDRDDLMDKCFAEAQRFYDEKEKALGPDILRQIESFLYLQVIDEAWKQHLSTMDHLREGIHLRSYGQKDPKQEYKKEGFNLFVGMKARVRDETLDKVFKAQVVRREEGEAEIARLQAERDARRAASRKANQRANTRSAIAPTPGPEVSARATGGSAAAAPAPTPATTLSASTSTAGSYSIAARSSVAGGYGGAFTSTASTASSPSTTASSPVAKAPATTPPSPAGSGSIKPMSAPRPSLRAELSSAADGDDGSGMNRADRRRLEAQKRKTEKRR